MPGGPWPDDGEAPHWAEDDADDGAGPSAERADVVHYSHMVGEHPDLNSTAASLLGFLESYGPMSGYDIVGMVEGSIGYFWNVTRSQVYRELNRLAEAELVEMGESGARARRPYTITWGGAAGVPQLAGAATGAGHHPAALPAPLLLRPASRPPDAPGVRDPAPAPARAAPAVLPVAHPQAPRRAALHGPRGGARGGLRGDDAGLVRHDHPGAGTPAGEAGPEGRPSRPSRAGRFTAGLSLSLSGYVGFAFGVSASTT